MILKNVPFGNIETDVFEFGHGSINMQPAFVNDEDTPVLMFKNNLEPREVGQTSDENKGKTSDDYKPQVVFVFRNEESLQALIDSLEDTRKNFKK